MHHEACEVDLLDVRGWTDTALHDLGGLQSGVRARKFLFRRRASQPRHILVGEQKQRSYGHRVIAFRESTEAGSRRHHLHGLICRKRTSARLRKCGRTGDRAQYRGRARGIMSLCLLLPWVSIAIDQSMKPACTPPARTHEAAIPDAQPTFLSSWGAASDLPPGFSTVRTHAGHS